MKRLIPSLICARARDLFQCPIRSRIVRNHTVSKQRDLYLELSDRSEFEKTPRQHGCRCACHISKRCDDLIYQSRGFETSRDLTIRRLIRYWNGAQLTTLKSSWEINRMCNGVFVYFCQQHRFQDSHTLINADTCHQGGLAFDRLTLWSSLFPSRDSMQGYMYMYYTPRNTIYQGMPLI